MKRDNFAGYVHTLCLKCTNIDGSAVKDDWKFTLNPPNVCSYSMSAPTTIIDRTLSYKKLSEANSVDIWPTDGATTWDDTLSNDIVTNPSCAITSCSLYDGGSCGDSSA